jgi:hypothetical protein
LEAFADYYNEQLDIYLLELCRIMGTRNQDSIHMLFRHPQIQRLMPDAAFFALAGAFDGDHPTNFVWLLNRLNIDPSYNGNLLFRTALHRGHLDVASILLNDMRVYGTVNLQDLRSYCNWAYGISFSRLWTLITRDDLKGLLIFLLLALFFI